MEISAYKPPIKSSLVLGRVLITVLAGFSSARLWAQKGPSFDCAKASTVVENTICANPSLAAMDLKLSSTYKAALALLSEDGRASLRGGQRQWVKVVRLVCDTTILPDSIFKDKTTPAKCIENKYRDRQKQLEEAVTTYGNIKIYRVDTFSAGRSPRVDDNTGADRGFVTLNVSYSQIDHPKSDSELAWNKKLACAQWARIEA
ncbi:MAG: lysozyme inhibitor LprI family protein [Terriglobia bacterium]